MKDEDLWVGDVPDKCELCEYPIDETFIDGKIKNVGGPWAIMCEDCHSQQGCGLGQGKGQKYQKQGDKHIKTAG